MFTYIPEGVHHSSDELDKSLHLGIPNYNPAMYI